MFMQSKTQFKRFTQKFIEKDYLAILLFLFWIHKVPAGHTLYKKQYVNFESIYYEK